MRRWRGLCGAHKPTTTKSLPLSVQTEGAANEYNAAIKALSNTNDPGVEDILLVEFKSAGTHMKRMICGALSTVATLRSIPVLKKAYKKTRDGFLRKAIDDAVYKIETREKNCPASS